MDVNICHRTRYFCEYEYKEHKCKNCGERRPSCEKSSRNQRHRFKEHNCEDCDRNANEVTQCNPLKHKYTGESYGVLCMRCGYRRKFQPLNPELLTEVSNRVITEILSYILCSIPELNFTASIISKGVYGLS